jgi:hypothetical protein
MPSFANEGSEFPRLKKAPAFSTRIKVTLLFNKEICSSPDTWFRTIDFVSWSQLMLEIRIAKMSNVLITPGILNMIHL